MKANTHLVFWLWSLYTSRSSLSILLTDYMESNKLLSLSSEFAEERKRKLVFIKHRLFSINITHLCIYIKWHYYSHFFSWANWESNWFSKLIEEHESKPRQVWRCKSHNTETYHPRGTVNIYGIKWTCIHFFFNKHLLGVLCLLGFCKMLEIDRFGKQSQTWVFLSGSLWYRYQMFSQ